MAKSYEVLAFLRPDGGYVQYGEEYEGIEFLDCEPFTKKEYQDTFKIVDELKKLEMERIQNAKKALLLKLGITEEEFAVLLA